MTSRPVAAEPESPSIGAFVSQLAQRPDVCPCRVQSFRSQAASTSNLNHDVAKAVDEANSARTRMRAVSTDLGSPRPLARPCVVVEMKPYLVTGLYPRRASFPTLGILTLLREGERREPRQKRNQEGGAAEAPQRCQDSEPSPHPFCSNCYHPWLRTEGNHGCS
jgi:hypothetical protein